MYKNIVVMIACLAIMVGLSGCQTVKPVTLPADPPTDDALLIGFSMATYKEERWLRDRDIFTAKAKDAGFKVIVQNANNDTEQQYRQVAEMIDKGIDVLVIAPHDASEAARAVALAKSSGIPVISYDRLVASADVDVYVSFDNVQVGQLMGQYLLSAAPKGSYILLNGAANDHNSSMFRSGYIDVLTSAVEAGKIKIVGETWVDDWRRELAYEYSYKTLAVYGDQVTGVVGANDSLAWAAIDALSEQRLIDYVSVVGQDADLAACKRIVAGTQLMTVYKPISQLVEQTIQLCSALANDQTLSITDTIDDGRYQVPYVKIAVIAVTADNIDDTVIKDGFYLSEDIYGE